MANGLSLLIDGAEAKKRRRAFFSFHYDDIMRVNNVRKSSQFIPGTLLAEPDWGVNGFYDGSLWESSKINGPEAVKRLIRDGVHNTSVVCVLVGNQTWQRRWVRYEIARSVIDSRGLLAVHINSINHHLRRVADPLGINPLSCMGIFKGQQTLLSIPQYYLAEMHSNGKWQVYNDYTQPVSLPKYIREPSVGEVVPLSNGAREYDFIRHSGYQNIGDWLDFAARAAGR